MIIEDDEPRSRAPLLPTPSLDRLGVEELQAYITGLRAEIARADAEIARKQALRATADSFFKAPG